MSEILFEAIPAADLTVFAQKIAARETDPLTAVLPNHPIAGFRTRSTKVSRTTTAAKFRSFDAETPIGKRPIASVVQDVQLAPLGQKLPLRESEILAKYLAGGTGNAANADLKPVVDTVYDDTENNVSAILNRALQLRGEFLFSGKLTINENGFIQEADYGLAADHQVAVGAITPWDNAAADPIDNETAWIEKVQDDAQENVTAVVMSSKVFRTFSQSPAYVKAISTTLDRITLAQVNEVRAAFNLPPVVICDAKVGGVRVTPVNKIALVTASVGEFQWGDTIEGIKLFGSKAVESAQAFAPKITAAAWIDEDPVTVWSKANATGLVVAGDINGLFVAEVLAA